MKTKRVLHESKIVAAYQARHVRLIVVGTGGIGGWVAQQLAFLVYRFNRIWNRAVEPRMATLLLVDYDLVEEKNVEARQNFCPPEVGKPKAQVLANRYQLAFNLHHEVIAARIEPFTPAMLPLSLADTLVILLGCVDNAEARASLARSLERSHFVGTPRIWWIDGGNDHHFGQVLCGNTAQLDDLQGAFREKLGARLPSPALLAPMLVEPSPQATDPAPRSFACGTVMDTGGDPHQSATINFHMASLMMEYVQRLLHSGISTFATYTNLDALETHSEIITPHALARALGQRDPDAFARRLLSARRKQKA